jgi:transposase
MKRKYGVTKYIETLDKVDGLNFKIEKLKKLVRTKEHILGNIFICAIALQLRSILRLKLKERGIDTSIEDAMRMLERLKAAHIAVGKDGEIQVYRKLRNIDGDLRKLVDVFKLSDQETTVGNKAKTLEWTF